MTHTLLVTATQCEVLGLSTGGVQRMARVGVGKRRLADVFGCPFADTSGTPYTRLVWRFRGLLWWFSSHKFLRLALLLDGKVRFTHPRTGRQYAMKVQPTWEVSGKSDTSLTVLSDQAITAGRAPSGDDGV